MFEKKTARLVSPSRANLNSNNLGRRSIDEVRNDMKNLRNMNNNINTNNTINNQMSNQSKIDALNIMKRINKNGN